MKLSTRVRYGVRAMIDLELNEHDSPVLVQAIAERQEISRKYLDNLLTALKAAGLVRSVRGARGGYKLAKHAQAITLRDISVALEGDPALTDCTLDATICSRVDTCPTRDVWKEMTESLEAHLQKTTLADIARKAKDKGQADSSMYCI